MGSNGNYRGDYVGAQSEGQQRYAQNPQYAPRTTVGTNDAGAGAFYSSQFQQVPMQQAQQGYSIGMQDHQQPHYQQQQQQPHHHQQQQQQYHGLQHGQHGYQGDFYQGSEGGMGMGGGYNMEGNAMGNGGYGGDQGYGVPRDTGGQYGQAQNQGMGSYSYSQPQQQQQPAAGASLQFPFQGMQQLGGNALGAQFLKSTVQSFVPQYAGHMFQQSSDTNQFMRLPKRYFMVDNMYVLRKLWLLLFPYRERRWARVRAVDAVPGTDNAANYLSPREDIHAPDLYIPVMSFVSYVLLVGFIYGTKGTFKPSLMGETSTWSLLMLVLEVVLIKLGMYLVNARPTPWLDIVAFRGYKFVGVNVAMIASLLVKQLYWPVLLYTATAMGVFLLRSHRRIILPRGNAGHPEDFTQQNYFLAVIFLLQYAIYIVLGWGVRP